MGKIKLAGNKVRRGSKQNYGYVYIPGEKWGQWPNVMSSANKNIEL